MATAKNIGDAAQSDYLDTNTPIDSPGRNAFAITTTDGATNFPVAQTRGLYVGSTGNVKVDLVGGGAVTFVAMAAGVIHPLQVTKVYLTGTTASNLVGVY